jgi:hypothetical protein
VGNRDRPLGFRESDLDSLNDGSLIQGGASLEAYHNRADVQDAGRVVYPRIAPLKLLVTGVTCRVRVRAMEERTLLGYS